MAKNAYAKRLDAARAARKYAIRRYTRQQMLDFVTIALGHMGYGEKRLKDFEQMLSSVYIEFAEAFTDDLKDDKGGFRLMIGCQKIADIIWWCIEINIMRAYQLILICM